jgi:hypothetical protein
MAKTGQPWKKGRGKLGVLAPLMGSWVAEADTPMGRVKCTRTFSPALKGSYIELKAVWDFGKGTYEELAYYGVDAAGQVTFSSFTSDGKSSRGTLADGTDVHPEAICFEAQMPAGLARMIYWPDEVEGIHWAVESRNKKGWNRFTNHHYKAVEAGKE